MARFRITLARMMAAILVAAIVLFIVRLEPEYRASAAFSFAIAALFAGILRALASSGGIRRGWIAFSLTGLTYMILAFGPWFSSQVGPHLITTRLLDDAFRRTGGMARPADYGIPLALTMTNNGLATHVSNDYYDRMRGLEGHNDFRRTGHSFIALLLAVAGVLGARGRAAEGG